MSYLKRHGTRRVPQWAAAAGPGSELGRRLRLGRRRLDAAAPLPDPRLGGRLVLRVRVDADARERAGGRAVRPRGRPARGGRDRPRLDRGPGAEERPGALRARARRGRRRRGDATRGARGAAAGGPHGHAPVPVRAVRRGLPRLGPLAASRGRPLVRGAAGRRARLPGGQVPPAGGRHAPRPAPPRSPGAPRRRRQPDARRLGRARSAVRVDRPRRRDGRPAAPGRGLRPRPGGGDRRARRRRSSASTACRARRSSRST